MLRVGLTGGLGSGKSTVAAMLRELGAHVIEADELGRAMMEPGEQVYERIVRSFGPAVVNFDGRLDRGKLAELVFAGGRLGELNGIVHPAVIEAEQRWMEEVFARDPGAVAVVESALIFEVERDARRRGEADGLLADWRKQMDRLIVVTAPDEVKIARFVARVCPDGKGREAAEADGRKRLSYQIPDAEKARQADFTIENAGSREELRLRVETVWESLRADSNKSAKVASLQ
jgi:dephospho-CoA kinase